jgi:hypothetical protein
MCSDQDHRDTVFYEPPHDLGHRPVSGWMTRPDAWALRITAARATATAEDRSGASTVTMLMIFSHVCALMTLAFLLDAARSASSKSGIRHSARSCQRPAEEEELIRAS